MLYQSPPKMKNDTAQKYADIGFADAMAGKPLSAIDDHPDLTGWASPAYRFSWIRGWEEGGGDIHRKVVVTEKQRLLERRAELLDSLARVNSRLKEIRASQRRGV
jgi:hypothetical protein